MGRFGRGRGFWPGWGRGWFGPGRAWGFGWFGPGRGRGNPYPFCRFFPWLPRRWWAWGPWGAYRPGPWGYGPYRWW